MFSMKLQFAKCNLGKVKLQANEVSGLLLDCAGCVGWSQGPFVHLVTYVASHAVIFELIFADLLLKRIFADSGSQPVPPLLCIGTYGVMWVLSTEFFLCDGVSWRLHAGVVAARRVAMDSSVQAPVQPLSHQFPSSSISDEFNYPINRFWEYSN